MRVKRLDLFGFKSFASRQSLTFGEGITGVVGPNGCGKSNVVDALRWVMGEQNARHLRGSNMQDIIFCGSEKKSPLGFAEVTLTMDNHDRTAPLDYNHYEEIQITRRLYKSGESEYEINKQKARLKDISDFFLGTGVGTKAYSIIEQGRINEVISAKPHERRNMIEEAAGITKYKAKKIQAERRMEATRQNLDRIIDIKGEIDKRVSVLAKEKAKLLEQQGLKDKLRNLDLHLATHRYLELSARSNYARAEHGRLLEHSSALKQDLAFKEQAFSSVLESYATKHEQRRTLEELAVHHQNTQGLLKKDLEYAKKTLEDNEHFIARTASQLADLEQREEELAHNIASQKEQQSLCEQELITLKSAIERKKDNGFGVTSARQHHLVKERDTQKKIIEASSTAARLQAEITAEDEKELHKKAELISLAAEIDTKGAEIKERISFRAALVLEHTRALERQSVLQEDLAGKEAQMQALTLQIASSTRELSDGKDEMRKLSARLSSLQEIDQQLEWSESGVAALKEGEKDLIQGVLADAITVKVGFEDLVEKCLTHILDAALINDVSQLKRATELLRTQKSQSTTFFLLDEKEGEPESYELASINDYVSIEDPRFLSLKPKLARYVVAHNLSEALSHWPAGKKRQLVLVTKDGEMLLPDGRAIIVGTKARQGVLKRKNEQLELEKKVIALNEALALQNEALNQKKAELATLESAQRQILDEHKPLMLGLIRLEESLKQKSTDISRMEQEQEKLSDKRKKLLETTSSADEKKLERQRGWAESLERHRTLTEELEDIKDAQIQSEKDYELYLAELKALEITKAGLDQKLMSLDAQLGDADKNRDLIATQQTVLLEQRDEKKADELKLKELSRQADKKIADLDQELHAIKVQLQTLSAECVVLKEQKESHELVLSGVQHALQKCAADLHDQELVSRDLANEVLNLCTRIEERYRAKLIDFITDFHTLLIDEPNAKRTIDELRRSLERMGTVNENAAVEYDDFKTRQDFLEAQISDLQDALGQLESAINKINKTTIMRFEEAFNGINKHFQVVFPRLFNGGRAELALTGGEDLLTAGVEILAKPPGKNISSIELLSGGEKALTAISLIMAIFLIKPSPFCLLDEVDAPLDEANVARFGQLIKEMSSRSQFIVITHNRKTMESADQLYGVTMEDAGSSKVVSVEVQQAFESIKQGQNKSATPKKPTQLALDNLS